MEGFPISSRMAKTYTRTGFLLSVPAVNLTQESRHITESKAATGIFFRLGIRIMLMWFKERGRYVPEQKYNFFTTFAP
jgi:hypothetical protein